MAVCRHGGPSRSFHLRLQDPPPRAFVILLDCYREKFRLHDEAVSRISLRYAKSSGAKNYAYLPLNGFGEMERPPAELVGSRGRQLNGQWKGFTRGSSWQLTAGVAELVELGFNEFGDVAALFATMKMEVVELLTKRVLADDAKQGGDLSEEGARDIADAEVGRLHLVDFYGCGPGRASLLRLWPFPSGGKERIERKNTLRKAANSLQMHRMLSLPALSAQC